MSKVYFTELEGYKLKDSELREEIGAVKEAIGYDDIYGFECDFENYTVRRLCAAVGKSGGSDFNSTLVWGQMRRCTVQDDGTVTSYYDDNNYIEDGSIGQVMVEIPKFYYFMKPVKLVAQTQEDEYDTNRMGYHIYKARWYVSKSKYGNMKVHPAFIIKGAQIPQNTTRNYVYIGAYSGIAYDVSESKYLLNDEQVIDVTATTGDKLSSIGGTYTREYTYGSTTITVTAGPKPASGRTTSNNLTRHNCTILAHNRGSGWEQQTIEITSAIQLLCAVEYCSFNWQEVIGMGITNIPDMSGVNCASFMGSTSSLGNSTGNAVSTVDYTGTSQTTSGKVSCNYRGIEDFFGNLWKKVEGINLYGDGTNGGGIPYYCADGVYTENVSSGNYVSVGFTIANARDYVKYFGYSTENWDWLFFPSKTGDGASSSVPVGDYELIVLNLAAYYGVALGWYFTSPTGTKGHAGAYYWNFGVNSTHRSRYFGCRLAYIPAA